MGLNDANIWVVIGFLVILHRCIVAANDGNTLMVMNIGVFVDPNARTGKEQTVGIEIAAEDFNKKSQNNKVELHFRNSSKSNPLQTAYSAIELIKEKKIEAIITGTENSEEVALMEEIANQYQVPVLSLAAASLSSSSQVEKHTFLVQLTNDYSPQINCTAMLVQNFGWKKVIVVYEDGEDLSTISSLLDLFSKELQGVGSEIEHLLALPPVGSVPYSKELIEELAKVFSKQSRVFVVLDSSIPMAIQLFKEANNMGLMGRETAWIVTDRIASLLDSLNSSTRSYMEGTLGIKTYYDEYSQNFMAFGRAFLLKMIAKYPNEQSFHPGIHALRAYDAITTIGNAFEIERKKREDYNISTSSDSLMHEILSSKFTGLSGKISIKNGALDEDVILYRIVNVVGKSYKELDFWSPKIGFVEKLREEDQKENSSEILNKMLNGMVNWPGDIKHVPIGYTMPSTMKPLKIGIPGNPPFDKFVMVETLNKNKTTYTGFCIDVFLEVVKIVEESYGLPFEFEVFNGTYDELIDRVHDKTYDAAVGDITILANRSNFVEFTQPYTKSGLSMIVPLKSKDSHKAKMLMKPFSWKLWLVTLCTLLYTMFGVWWIESQIDKNSDFEGSLTNQLSSALWYTFSSIFFAQRENIQSNLTRPLVAVWMCVVFVMTSSYTASLTAMLTVPLLEPIKVRDVEWLKKTNSKVGCDGGSVWDYLVNVQKFNPQNIKNVSSQYDYQELFDNNTIVAAFLELPYKKLLVNQYCKSFTSTKHTFGFGAQGFVFQKGSPTVDDVSKAILKLSENGVLKELEDKWFSNSECPTSSNVVERLNPKDFLALYIIYGVISIICLLSSVAYMIRRYREAIAISSRNRSIGHWTIWMVKFLQFYLGGNHRNSQITPITEYLPSVTQTDDRVGRTLEISTRTT